MAGCGSKKKMAKGGMVSPRKAMAMGKKPKKFAKGGMARSGAPVLNSTNVDTARPRGMAPANVTAPRPVVTPRPATNVDVVRPRGMAPVNVSGMTGGPRGTMAPMGPKKFAKGGAVKKGKK